MMLIQYLKDPKSFFEYNNNPKDPTSEKSWSEVNKPILATKVRQYIEQEESLTSNMKKIYDIIWGQCTPGIQSVLKVN